MRITLIHVAGLQVTFIQSPQVVIMSKLVSHVHGISDYLMHKIPLVTIF